MVEVLDPVGVQLAEVTAGTGTGSDQGGLYKLGQRVQLDDGGEAMYVHAAGAIAQGHVVSVDENFEAVSVTTATAVTGHFLGVAADVALADNEFGWIRIKGSNFNVLIAQACAPDVALYTTATAGVLDDAATSSLTLVRGIRIVASGSSSGTKLVECIIAIGAQGQEDPSP